MNFINKGETFGMLTALSDSLNRDEKIDFLCECGSVKNSRGHHIYYGKTKSCGCLVRKSGRNSHSWKGGEFVPSRFYSRAKKGAEARGLCWDLNIAYLDKLWVDQNEKCAYTGEILIFGTNSNEQTASLDRIDSRMGYVENNVQYVHKNINEMKWNWSEEKFLNAVIAVYHFKVIGPDT